MPFPSNGVNVDPRSYFQQAPQYSYYGQHALQKAKRFFNIP